jgi:hypothetical protein
MERLAEYAQLMPSCNQLEHTYPCGRYIDMLPFFSANVELEIHLGAVGTPVSLNIIIGYLAMIAL